VKVTAEGKNQVAMVVTRMKSCQGDTMHGWRDWEARMVQVQVQDW
jgi:hypothetical protein